MSSEQDYNAMVSGAKIEPLASPTKRHVPHDDHGVIGEDRDIEKDHLEPLDSPIKHHHTQLPHADSQGVVGREDIIQGTKIAPMEGKVKQATEHTGGLDDENVDSSRIRPMGEVREN